MITPYGPSSSVVLEPRDGEAPTRRCWGRPAPAMQADSVAIFHVTAV